MENENNELKISEFRYERKFFISDLSKYEVEGLVRLHPGCFSEIYSKRYVNNIYFDSFSFKNLNDNVEGVSDRIKIRIRWYGNLFGYIQKPKLEIKIKKGLLGMKKVIPITSFFLDENTDFLSIIYSIKNLSEILQIDLNAVIPTLVNRYSRTYYLSNNKNFRITIDSEQSFYHVKNINNSFLNHHDDKDSVILELKYDKIYDDDVKKITSIFPFRITKSSKYVKGLQRVLQISF